jgi:hypothetical protein
MELLLDDSSALTDSPSFRQRTLSARRRRQRYHQSQGESVQNCSYRAFFSGVGADLISGHDVDSELIRLVMVAPRLQASNSGQEIIKCAHIKS